MNKVIRVGCLLLPVAAFAAEGDLDFTAITGGVALGGVALSIIAMGALKMGPTVAKWATNKLVGMFGR